MCYSRTSLSILILGRSLGIWFVKNLISYNHVSTTLSGMVTHTQELLSVETDTHIALFWLVKEVNVGFCCHLETGSHIAQAGLELSWVAEDDLQFLIFLPPSLKCWGWLQASTVYECWRSTPGLHARSANTLLFQFKDCVLLSLCFSYYIFDKMQAYNCASSWWESEQAVFYSLLHLLSELNTFLLLLTRVSQG